MSVFINNNGTSVPVDPDSSAFQAAIHASFANVIDIQVSPASGATGVSTTPTLTTQVGDPIDYGHFTLSTDQATGIADGAKVLFDTVSAGNMSLASNSITLRENHLYEMFGNVPRIEASAVSGTTFQFYDDTNAAYIGTPMRTVTGSYVGDNYEGGMATAVIRPATDITVSLRMVDKQSTTKIGGEAPAGTAVRPSITVHQLDPRAMYYTWGATEIQVRHKASGVVVYDSGEVASLTAPIVSALDASTEYEWRARHKEAAGYWLKWSAWQPFTTA